jgi:hypothetical protein
MRRGRAVAIHSCSTPRPRRDRSRALDGERLAGAQRLPVALGWRARSRPDRGPAAQGRTACGAVCAASRAGAGGAQAAGRCAGVEPVVSVGDCRRWCREDRTGGCRCRRSLRARRRQQVLRARVVGRLPARRRRTTAGGPELARLQGRRATRRPSAETSGTQAAAATQETETGTGAGAGAGARSSSRHGSRARKKPRKPRAALASFRTNAARRRPTSQRKKKKYSPVGLDSAAARCQ